MSYRTHCDWCGAWLAYEADQAEIKVAIYHREGKSRLDATWSEEDDITRHFCAAPKVDTDRGGRDRAGMVPQAEFDSCYHRAIAAICGEKLKDPGMGMEWRLVPVATDEKPIDERPQKPKYESHRVPEPPPADPAELVEFAGREITSELRWVIEEKIASSYAFVLPHAGIVSLDQIAAMTDAEVLSLKGVGQKILTELRAALARRNPGLALVREAFGVIVHGIYDLSDDDPCRPALAQAGEVLTAALAENAVA